MVRNICRFLQLHNIPLDSSITETPCIRNHKRSLGLSDVDEPSPAKRRRVRSTQRAAKETSNTQSRTDHLVLDITSADESLKPSKRKTTVSKASTKTGGNETALDDPHEGPLQSGLRQPGCPDGHQLSAIPDVEEIVHQGQAVCKASSKGSPSGLRVAGLGLATQKLGVTKRRRKKVKVQQEDSDIQDQGVDQAVGISKSCSGRCAMSPLPVLSESGSLRQHRCLYDQRDLPVSKARKSTTRGTSQSKPKDHSREPVAHSNDIGVVASVKTSKKKKVQAKENKVGFLRCLL